MLRQYKGDFLSSSGESESDPEVGNILKLCNVKCEMCLYIFQIQMLENGDLVKINGRKYSSQLREFNDFDENKEDTG